MLSPFTNELAVRIEHAVLVDRLERRPWHRHAEELSRRRREERRKRGERSELRRGARSMLPFLVGYVPFGLVVGSTVAAHGPVTPRLLGTVLLMGGSAQLAVLQLLDAGAALVLVVLAGLAVNARLLVYSASLAPEWSGAGRRFRLAAALGIIDPTWAVAQSRRSRGGAPDERRAFYAGAALTLCTGWTVLVATGAAAGRALDVDATAVAIPLCLLHLVLPRLVTFAGRAVVGTAATVGWFGAGLPAGTGVLLAVVAGAAAGAAAERAGDRKAPASPVPPTIVGAGA